MSDKLTIKQYAEKKLAEAAKAKSQDVVVGGDAPVVTETDESKSREINKSFFSALAGQDGAAMAQAQKSIRDEYKAKAQTIGTDSEGGILVPLTVDQNIQRQLEYISPIRQIARVISNAPAKLRLPSATGGAAYWVAEAATISTTAVTFASKDLVPEKLASIIPGITLEFLQDAAINPSAQALLESQLATKAALKENDAFVNGDGTDKPFGFRSSAVTPYSQTQAGAALAYGDLVALMFKLPTAYRNQGTFVMGSVALAKLIGMEDEQGRPLFIPSITEGAGGTLLGRPVVIVDEIPTNVGTGSNKTEIWYGVFSDYVIGDRLGTTFDLGTAGDDFNKAQYTLRMLKRVGGIPTSNNFAKLTDVA
ncbi:phage major capsid protein [Rhodococcus sp. IEGM 1351]|uniref:phage major capsid protein n=1 Tax=Rhodococcus sp. IEGM 1351 TaxID=3047089 RepID=UPI0024B73228|nr:phage major capsid protein [Rhodococcus sp. IEGM 1351]MDI9934692.1 phage major capsid protein [Rhodococcus sp. IEGM 1351]